MNPSVDPSNTSCLRSMVATQSFEEEGVLLYSFSFSLFIIFLPQPPECCGYRYRPRHLIVLLRTCVLEVCSRILQQKSQENLPPNWTSPPKIFDSFLWKIRPKCVLSVLGNHRLSCSAPEWHRCHLLWSCGFSLLYQAEAQCTVSTSVASLADPGKTALKEYEL